MKTKVFNFVRGLRNGTPPRFQSYLKSLTLILTLLLSVNMWGAVEYNKIAWGDIANGDTIIIVGVKSSTNYVMVQATPPTPTSVSVSQDKITTFTANTEFVAEVSGSTIKFRKAGTTNYLVGTNANNGLKIDASGSNSNVFSLDNTASGGPRLTFTYASTQRWCGIYNTQDWRCYTSKDQTNISGTSTLFFKKKAASTYTVNWTINPAAGGTLSATSGTSTTVTPNSAYTYGSPAYTVTPSSAATVSQNTNTFTATPSANCTIRINMVEKPKYTVTLKDDNSKLKQESVGASVTLPSRTGCTGYTFAGWTKSWASEQSSWTTTAPTIIKPGSYTPEGNENLYPVYTKTGGGGGTTTKTLYFEPFTGSANSSAVLSTNVAATTDMFTDASATVWSHYSFNAGSTTAYATNLDGDAMSNGTKITKTINNTTVTMMEVTGINISNASNLSLSLYNRRSYTAATLSISYKIDDGDYTAVGGTISYNSTNDRWKLCDGLTINGTGNSLSLKIQLVVSGTTNRTMTLDDIKIIGTVSSSTTSYISVPNCGPSTYTLDLTASPAGYGTVSQESLANVASGTSISASGATLTVGSTKITASPTPQTNQYTYAFSNWTGIPNTGKITEDVTITANFTRMERTYSVTYKDQGGANYSGNNAGSLVANYTYGTGATLVAGTKLGFNFEGWYDNSDCTGDAVTTISTTATGDKTYYAKWSENLNCNWVIKGSWDGWNDTDHRFQKQSGQSTVSSGSVTITIASAGIYEFKLRQTDGTAYDCGADYTYEETKVIGDNIQLCSSYSPNCKINAKVPGDYTFTIDYSTSTDCPKLAVQYPAYVTVTFNMNGHGDAIADKYCVLGGTVSAPANPSAANFIFGGWYENASCTGDAFNFSTTLNANKTLYAKWTFEAPTYYYKGNQTSWSSVVEMTPSADHLYSYFAAKGKDNLGSNNNFLIQTLSTGGTIYGGDYLSAGFNGTNITNMGKWDGDINACIYNAADFYIIVYYPNTAINTSSSPKICASTSLPGNFYVDGGAKLYFDNTLGNWAEGKQHLRIGRSDHSTAVPMTKVTGTANLYQCTVPEYANYFAFTVANSAGWTGIDNTIYQPSDKQPTGEYAITEELVYQNYLLDVDYTLLPTSKGSTEKECTYINTNHEPGMKMQNVSITEYSHGTVNVAYTDIDGSASNFTTGNRNVAHTCILTITATPETGARLVSLKVNGNNFTSGQTFVADATTEITAVFSNEWTLTWDYAGGTVVSAGTAAGSVAYGTTLTAPTLEKTGYDFADWNPAVPATMPAANSTYTAQWTLAQYTINPLNLTGCSVTGTAWPTGTKAYGSSFSTTISANDGYNLPSEITVTGATYTWDPATGALVITSVTGEVTVTITAVEKTYSNYRTTCCIRLGKVQVNNVSYLTTTSAQLNWTAQANATSYTLVLDGGTPIENITENHYSVTGLNPGSTHSFTVQAIGDGEYHCDGAVSNAKTFYTKINVTLTREGDATSTDLTSSDGTYSFPGDEADACTGWSFDGWSANSNVDGSSYTKVITPTHGSTYYAVYVNAGTYKTLPPCGPQIAAEMTNNNIVAVNGSWSAGLSEVALSAYNLTMGVEGGVTIKFVSTNDNFKLKENTTSGAGALAANLSFLVPVGDDAWNQNIVVTYNPTTAGATETATITVKVMRTNGTTEYARTQFTVKGYSLPAEFVMATKVDGNWYTMTEVAAASGNTPSPGTQLVVDDATNPTIITGVADGYLPSITVFTPATRPTPNTNAECVRFESQKKPGNYLRVPDDNTYLYFNSENSTSNSYWRMTPNPSVEGEFYIALPNNAYGRSLSAKDGASGKTTFGHFKTTTSWRLLPLSNEVQLCTRYIAPNVQVTKFTNGSNDVTLKVSSTNGEPETLGYEYSTDQTSWTAMSGTGTSATVTLTGLTKGTEYTYYVRGIVTDGTENCSGEKEVTFSPFNPIVTVTPSSLDLTCLAGETDTKTLTITPNPDAAGWTIGANPITGANASMFSFNAGTSEVTFSPAAGTADGNYTATLTIRSKAGNVSANVTLMGTVVSKAAMVFGIEDMQNGMICEKQITYPATGIYVYLNNGSAVYSAGDRTTKANATSQISSAVFIRDLSTGGADVQTGFSYGVDAGVAHFIIKQANLVYGHTYRISYYNDLANDGNGLFNAAGLGFADGYVDFVYSADCSKPTAILPCITSPTTAVANWEYADCDGNATVEVYTKTSNVVHDKSLKEACNNWGYAKRNKAAWGLVGTSNSGSYPAATWGWTLYQGGNTYVYSPEMSEISSSITNSTVVTVTVTMKNSRNYACTMDVYPVICASNPANTNPTFTQKTAYFDQSTTKDIGSYSVPANANGETIEFTISGLESNYSLCFASRASQIALFVQNVKFEIKGKNSFKTLTPSCSAEEVEITGLSANTKYYYTVTNGGKTSNEIEFTTWASGASSVQFYNNEARTSQYEIASSDNILVLGGEQTTVYLKGTKVAGCEPVVSVSAGYRIEDHSTYNPSTGALGGYVVLTLADPTQTAGTLTVTDGAGGTTVRNIISSTCPAGMNTMALPATDIEANSATANWNNGLTFDADDKSGKLYIFRDGSVDRELIENGGFETGDLTGWNYVNVGGLYACDAYNVVNSNGHSGSYSLHVTEEGSLYSGFAYSTVIYQNPMTLYPGTYVMTSWVKITAADCSGYSDKKAYFVQGLVGHQNQGSTNQTCFAISSASTNRTRNNTYTTVTSNGTYVQLVDTFVLSKTIKALPIVGERCDISFDFRKFYLDDVTMTRISAPISEDYDKLIEIADLSAASSVAMTGLSGNTQYSYMIQDANGCSSNVITFKTLQSGEPSIEAEGIELSASQDKTATGVIVVTALDAYAPITITKCLDSKISLNTNTLPAEGGAIRVTFAPGATAAGTSGTCELSLITTGMLNPVTVNVLWTVTAGEDVNTPKVDVTEVWTDQLTIEHNVGMDEVDSVYVQFSREKTGEEIVKNVGDEIFFSKYYEAYSHKKLWAIFNPTNDTISLAGMEVWRSKSDGTWNTDEVMDLSDAGFYEQGWIYPQEEIVVYTADQVGGCEQRHVDMSTWYAGAHADLALSFSGDDALLLVRNTAEESEEKHNELPTKSAKDGTSISWPDAIYERSEEWHMLDIIGAHNGSYNPTSEACTNWNWYNSKTKATESGDDKGWVGYGSDMDNKRDYNDGKGHEGYLLSTNRCLLVRNKSVTSGANALATNITDMFTLNTEWQGSHVPTSTPGMTQDSVSCINFSYVGGYNYSGYYNSWTEMDDYEVAAEPNPDGSWTVEVDVPIYSCKMFHIEAVKMDTINGVVSPNVVTSIDYKVPIVVAENKVTTADLFQFGGDTCATCDVVVRDEATLSHVTGGKSQFRELIVYPGAKFDNSSKQGFLLDRITVQSKNTEVGYAIINDNGSTIDAGEVRHVKRVDDQHWYSFSLPYDCKISSIQQQNGKSMGEYSEDWVIAYYDGARRQADKADEHIGESSQYWIDMPSDGVLEANKAYIIGLYTTEWPGQVKNVYFPPYVAGGHKAYSESGDDAKTANIYNWTAGVADNPARNHGWNFVGSPYISKFNETTDGQGLNNGSLIMKGKMNEAGEITEDLEHVYISIPADADMMTYNQVLASSQKILPFTGYFVQAIDPTGSSDGTLELEYAKGNRTLTTPERRATATRQRVLVELNVIAPNGDKDNTGIWVDDRYTVNYEIGRDLMKIYGEAGRPQLYSRAADNIAMAYIALPDDNAEYIPLELYAPKAGKYTLKIDDNTSMTAGAQTIELLYNNATVADLFFDTYDIEATKAGTIKGYAVRIRRWAQVITSDEQIGGQNITIIANDGQMSVTNLPANATVTLYDVLGHLMATGYAVDGVVNFNTPATGVYNIVVESAVGHTTIKTVIK